MLLQDFFISHSHLTRHLSQCPPSPLSPLPRQGRGASVASAEEWSWGEDDPITEIHPVDSRLPGMVPDTIPIPQALISQRHKTQQSPKGAG